MIGGMSRSTTDLRVSVPEETWLASLADEPGTELVVWDPREADQPDGHLDLVVWPYDLGGGNAFTRLDVSRIGLVQLQSLGYDGVADAIGDGGRVANAVGVHEESTAELAVALTLAALRELPSHVRQQECGEWRKAFTSSLIDRRVMLLGHGGIGTQVAARLEGFGCELVRVASKARDEDGVHVHGTDELQTLLPTVDVVVVAVPYSEATHHLVDAGFLAALPDGALVVNVARGKVADTDAILAEAGRLRFASDVWDPEPLPADHPLWAADGVLVSPHVGGMTSAMRPRIERVVRGQLARLRAGEEPADVVVG